MLRALDVSSGALNIAGICGVPFVGAAATVVDGIVKTCEEVKVHKVWAQIRTFWNVKLMEYTAKDKATFE